MTESAVTVRTGNHNSFIRLGGFAILVTLVIHIVANAVLKKLPPEDPTLAELKTYLSEEASAWAWVHGLRYVAFSCIVIFAAALFMRTCRVWGTRGTGWGLVGLLGAALLVTNGIITNGIETLAFTDFGRLSEDPKLFWLVFHLTRFLFTAEVLVAWALVVGGFSMAGLLTSTLPKWLAILGLLSAAASLVSGAFIVSVLTSGWAAALAETAPLGSLAWFLITGVLLAFQGGAESEGTAV
jgi:hypothetical protein